MKSSRPQFANDFFFELMKDSQRLRAGYLAERERWLSAVAIDGREELLFELEMLLRGIERYFNLHNLPLEEQGPVVARDFTEELKCTRDAVNRCALLARRLLDPPADQRLMFRKYLESRVADDRVRHDLIEQELDQATPQESLFLIRSGFVALRGIIDALLKLPHCGYGLFSDVGQMALREVALNKYFKPLRPMEFRTEYDRIKSVRVLEIVRGIASLDLRRPITLAFLALFRLLHYLRYLPDEADSQVRRAHVVVALVHSEFQALSAFLDAEASRKLEARAPDKARVLTRVAVALKRDSARTWKRELGQVGRATPAAVVRVKQDFVSLCKQQVALLAGVFEPKLSEMELFDDVVSRQEQAKRLRLDLCAYREVIGRMTKALTSPVMEEARDALDGLRKFIAYFRDVSYQLLRYGDYEPFDRFQALVADLESPPPAPVQRARMEEDLRLFAAVLDKTFSSVCRREELSDSPFDELDGAQLAELFVHG
jgi:hypothetical protein